MMRRSSQLNCLRGLTQTAGLLCDRSLHWLPAAVVLLCAAVSSATTAADDGVDLSADQREAVLREAMLEADRGASVRLASSQQAQEAFANAAAKFQLLVDSGVRNGRLYYNLANAYLESGRVGQAILNYRRAEELLPGDGRIEHNLRFARSLCRTQIEKEASRAFVDTLLFWHHGSSLLSRFRIAIVVNLVLWLLVLCAVLLPRYRWRYAIVPVVLVWLAIGFSVVADAKQAGTRLDGVLTADEVMVRKGNGERFAPQFEQMLYQGVEFRLLEEHLDWWHIELPDGKNGWIKADQAELI